MSYAIPIAQVLGISGAAFASGLITSYTVVSVPTVEGERVDVMAPLWKKFYDIGATVMPPLALTCSTCFGFLAYQTRHVPQRRLPVAPYVLYTVAALAVPTIVPYTFTAMWSTVTGLEKRAARAADAPNDSETRQLLREWSMMNVNRALLAGSAALLAGVAIVGN